MKKIVLIGLMVLFLVLVFTVVTASADNYDYLYGKWRYEGPDGLIIYEFASGGKGGIVAFPRNPSKYYSGDSIIFDFSYTIEKMIIIESSINSFKEYYIKMNFGFFEGDIKIKFEDDRRIEISDAEGKVLTLIRVAQLMI